MLTLGQLLQSSDPAVFRTFRKYALESFKLSSVNDENQAYIQALGVMRGGKELRKASMRTPDPSLNNNARVQVYCSCDYFIYRLEMALVAQGNALHLRSDGTYPTQTNLQLKPGLCPHLACLSHAVLNSGAHEGKHGKHTTPKQRY